VLTVPAVTAKVAEVEPCGTVTVVGTLRTVLSELESDTDTPPLPAAAVKLTVPVPEAPLVIELGLTDTLLRAALVEPCVWLCGGSTVSPVVVLKPEYEAVSVTEVAVLTDPAVTVKLADVRPWGTVTETGTPAAGTFELESDTVTPPLPAGAVKLTAPVLEPPLATAVGLTDTLLRVAATVLLGSTVAANVTRTPLYVAVMVTCVATFTLVGAFTVKLPEVAPFPTVTVAGTPRMLGWEEVRLTIVIDGAAAVMATRPVPEVPPMIGLGLIETLLRAKGGGLTVTLTARLAPA